MISLRIAYVNIIVALIYYSPVAMYNLIMQTDNSINTIDDFIEKYPEKTQQILQEIRKTIQGVIPGYKETISYGIPTFTLNGKNLVHFSAYEKHIGFYPGSAPITQFQDKLKGFKTSKGTVQFPIDKPIPLDLIKKITIYCVEQNMKKEN